MQNFRHLLTLVIYSLILDGESILYEHFKKKKYIHVYSVSEPPHGLFTCMPLSTEMDLATHFTQKAKTTIITLVVLNI